MAVRPSECRQRPAKEEQVKEEDGISDKNRSGFPGFSHDERDRMVSFAMYEHSYSVERIPECARSPAVKVAVAA